VSVFINLNLIRTRERAKDFKFINTAYSTVNHNELSSTSSPEAPVHLFQSETTYRSIIITQMLICVL